MTTIPEQKLLCLKYIKHFKGEKENSNSTNKKAKSKAKVFFPRKWGFSQNKIAHSLQKITIHDSLFLFRERKFTLTLFPFLRQHPNPINDTGCFLASRCIRFADMWAIKDFANCRRQTGSHLKRDMIFNYVRCHLYFCVDHQDLKLTFFICTRLDSFML